MDRVADMCDASVIASKSRTASPSSPRVFLCHPVLPLDPQPWDRWLARATGSGCDEGVTSLATRIQSLESQGQGVPSTLEGGVPVFPLVPMSPLGNSC